MPSLQGCLWAVKTKLYPVVLLDVVELLSKADIDTGDTIQGAVLRTVLFEKVWFTF